MPVTTPHFAPASGTDGAAGAAGASGGAAAAPAPAPAAAAPAGTGAGGAPQLSASTAAAVASRGTPATLNLDDIFGDCFFTPEGDAVFLGDQAEGGADGSQSGGGVVASAEAVPTRMASRPAPNAAAAPAPAGAAGAAAAASGGGGGGTAPSSYVPVSYGGGISTTGLDNPSQAKSTVMGATAAPSAAGAAPAPKPVPFVQPPQQRHHLQYATPAMLGAARTMPAGGAKRKTSTGSAGARSDRKMSDKQKVERR